MGSEARVGRLGNGLIAPPAAWDTLPSASASRISRLDGTTRLAHADLHNHTLLSDGSGDPELAFASMRIAGMDVARRDRPRETGRHQPRHGKPAGAVSVGRRDRRRVVETAGARRGRGQRPGAFVALRGFEWSSPSLGHVNVWGSSGWTHPLRTGAFTPADWSRQWIEERLAEVHPSVLGHLERVMERAATTPSAMKGLFDWLAGIRSGRASESGLA